MIEIIKITRFKYEQEMCVKTTSCWFTPPSPQEVTHIPALLYHPGAGLHKDVTPAHFWLIEQKAKASRSP